MNNIVSLDNILPSLIVLKNSIVQGKIPKSSDLEIGELALSLYKGEESIWAKNSNSEVINLLSPRPDLFWGDFFKIYETLDEFNLDLESGSIKNDSIVFIKKEKLIWTGGVIYASSYSLEEIQSIINEKFIFLSQEVFNLNESSTSDQISVAFGGEDEFKNLVNKVITSDFVSSLKSEYGSCPVSLISSIIENEYHLNIEWIITGVYNKISIVLLNSNFSITNLKKDLIGDIEKVENEVSELKSTVNDINMKIGYIGEELDKLNSIKL